MRIRATVDVAGLGSDVRDKRAGGALHGGGFVPSRTTLLSGREHAQTIGRAPMLVMIFSLREIPITETSTHLLPTGPAVLQTLLPRLDGVPVRASWREGQAAGPSRLPICGHRVPPGQGGKAREVGMVTWRVACWCILGSLRNVSREFFAGRQNACHRRALVHSPLVCLISCLYGPSLKDACCQYWCPSDCCGG